MNLIKFLPLLLCLAGSALAEQPAKIIKVLPQFLDREGRISTTPSLYSRDAYQALLRAHPERRSGLRFAVQWKGPHLSALKLKVEMRGLRTNDATSATLEAPISRKGLFSTWSEAALTGQGYKKFGEMVSWRVTLWDGNQPLAEQKSFLW